MGGGPAESSTIRDRLLVARLLSLTQISASVQFSLSIYYGRMRKGGEAPPFTFAWKRARLPLLSIFRFLLRLILIAPADAFRVSTIVKSSTSVGPRSGPREKPKEIKTSACQKENTKYTSTWIGVWSTYKS